MTTPYKALSFEKNEALTQDMINQVYNNYQWIWENSPKARVKGTAGRQRANVVVVGGKTHITQSRKYDIGSARVLFGDFFHPTCHPHITTGIINGQQAKVFCTLSGLYGRDYPDHNGFEIVVNVAAILRSRDEVGRHMWVAWMATGFGKEG